MTTGPFDIGGKEKVAMKKRALIVGIQNYGGRVVGLESPDREILEWRDLLVETYGFPSHCVRLLANERARKEELGVRLKWLLADAQPGDQLVFIYCGHGIRLPERNMDNGELLDHMDEALLCFPLPDEDLAKVAFYDDDLFKLLGDKALPEGAKVTFILDCCFGGGFNLRDAPRRPNALTVDLPLDLEHRLCHRAEQPDLYYTPTAVPVLVSAAGELNLAVEIDIGGVKRSNFSYHAIEALRKDPSLTYAELIEQIREPIEAVYPQYPAVKGNARRRNRQFFS
jgi:Caspase domain